jgi:hypothetical protein
MKNIQVDITDAGEFHCFRLTFRPPGEPRNIEIMLHASALVDLIHECSTALCQWQKETTTYLICQKTGMTEEEARREGLIA